MPTILVRLDLVVESQLLLLEDGSLGRSPLGDELLAVIGDLKEGELFVRGLRLNIVRLLGDPGLLSGVDLQRELV